MPNYSKEVASLAVTRKIAPWSPTTKWDSNEEKLPMVCEKCQQRMHIYKEIGNHVWWTCDTTLCLGNKDTPRIETSNREFVRDINRVGDPDKYYIPFHPRKVC